jgi:hypothetical protein
MCIAGSGWRFWHRVNGQDVLERFVASGCTVAEGDVLWGRLEGDPEERVIMAHPPETTSDLSFERWVESAVKHGHALKVDFKTPRVVPPVLTLLADRVFNPDRLILNADVAIGPGGESPLLSVDDMREMRRAFPEAILSLGLTTASWGGAYQADHVNMLLNAAATLGGPVTVGLRLELFLADVSVLKPLEEADCHVTIWNDPRTSPATGETLERIRTLAPHAFIDLCDSSGVPVHLDEATGMN